MSKLLLEFVEHHHSRNEIPVFMWHHCPEICKDLGCDASDLKTHVENFVEVNRLRVDYKEHTDEFGGVIAQHEDVKFLIFPRESVSWPKIQVKSFRGLDC